MVSKKGLMLLLLVISSTLLFGCEGEEIIIEEDPVIYRLVNVNLGFTPNMVAEFNSSLTYPPPGIRRYEDNESLTLLASESDVYEFNHWYVKPRHSEGYEVFERNYTIKINDNYTVTAFFGCSTNEVCEEGHGCDLLDGVCVDSGRIQLPPLIIALSEIYTDEEEEVIDNFKLSLFEQGYENIPGRTTFSEVNMNQLGNSISVFVLGEEVVIVTGSLLQPRLQETSRFIKDSLISENVSSEKIISIDSYEIIVDDIYSLFN